MLHIVLLIFEYQDMHPGTSLYEMRNSSTKTLLSRIFLPSHLEDPDEKVEILQTLIQECLERHAPLRRIKLTRPPPAPWMNDLNIRSLQQQCRLMQFEAHINISPVKKNGMLFVR